MFPLTLQDVADPTGPLRWILAGLIASWAFYALTAHPKLSISDQTYQGLIFIGLIQAVLLPFKNLLFLLNGALSLGVWSQEVQFLWTIFFALFIGVLVSFAANHDFPHWVLRDYKITKCRAFPSVWYSYFNDDKNSAWAIIHLRGDKDTNRPPRRLYGYVDEWPDHPNTSHFILSDVEWLSATNQSTSLDQVYRMLIATVDVELVEIVKDVKEGEYSVKPPVPRRKPTKRKRKTVKRATTTKRTKSKRAEGGSGGKHEADVPATETITATITTEDQIEGSQT